jgi:hypothetical protein
MMACCLPRTSPDGKVLVNSRDIGYRGELAGA